MVQTILGSGGVIGTEVAKLLPEYSDIVRLVSRHPKPVLGREELVSTDLLNVDETREAIKGSDIAYLCVGLKYTTKVWQTEWPIIMKNVIDACEKHDVKLVFFDNVYMYGKVEGFMSEDTPYNPCSKKGEVRAKIATTLQDAMRAGRIKAIIARSADFYGKGADVTFAMPMIFDKYKESTSALWLLDKTQPHSMTYTPDAARALVTLGNINDAYNQVWHLPTDKNVLTGEEFMNKVAEAYKVEPKQSVISSWMLTIVGWFVPTIKETKELSYQFDSPYLFDSSKFEEKFFKATTYEDAIKEIAVE